MALHPAPWPTAERLQDSAGRVPGAASTLAAGNLSTMVSGDDRNNEFDDLVYMASQLLNAPIALIAVEEGENFHMVAERGYGKPMVPREHAICRAVNHETPLLFVSDAAADPRFRDDPAVACADGVRFYLGIALFGSTGEQVGVLAVADSLPRAAVPADTLAMLHRLARLTARLVDRRVFERNNRLAEQIARADSSAVVVVDATGAVTFVNVVAQAVFGLTVAIGQPLDGVLPPAPRPDPVAVKDCPRGASGGLDIPVPARKLRIRDVDGALRTLQAVRCAWPVDGDSATVVKGSGPTFPLILRDITDRHRSQHRHRCDQQDPLTGLPNVAALMTKLGALRMQTLPLGVALLGLNNFRAVNNTLGHGIGDAVLQVVACRLLSRLPAEAYLARFDGDEFVLVFPDAQARAIETLLRTMLRDLARPCEVDHQLVHLEASIGLVMHDGSNGVDDEHGARIDARELLARAGLAMQHAKRAIGQQLRLFQPDMRAAAIDRRKLDLELRRASREGEFELHYQPQIDLASGLPTGAEALLRWRHPERGLLLPIAFIDALAHSPVALTVGRWILQRACCDAAAWPEVGGRRLAVGVNLFPVQFDDEHLLDEVDHALALSGLPPDRLEIELTEIIALNDNADAEHILMRLRARGVRVAYDDFGTGFASLSMLHRLPADRVKIDRSFVRNVMENRGDEAIVRSIALIAHNFDLKVIAEGVETPDQADFLRELGCQEVQGWLYSKALAPLAFDIWLAARSSAPAMRAVMHG